MSESSDQLTSSLPERRRWTREEFERAGELGLFQPGERLELIGGEVISKVTPQKSLHATAIGLTTRELERAFPTGHYVRVQLPLALSRFSEPEPDLAVVNGEPRDYAKGHPTTAALVVEVADSTLKLDRGPKASLYAQAGIAEYWIVNLRDQVLELHREPVAAAEEPFGHQYASVTRHPASATVSVNGERVLVRDLLP